MLSDTLLVPRLILPYLDKCVRQAAALEYSSNTESSGSHMTKGLETPALAQGIASSLRTLVSKCATYYNILVTTCAYLIVDRIPIAQLMAQSYRNSSVGCTALHKPSLHSLVVYAAILAHIVVQLYYW
jgi:hypothetical protein